MIIKATGVYSDYPYLTGTSYTENYRGQYHYSPPSGWMNDINGLWYYEGVYHLTYQSSPHDLTSNGDDIHWAHATSRDLIHWTQQPVALEPGRNSVRSAWSGSTVVDLKNTSGFSTSSDPVVVTIYTGTTKGTCLAYSNDLGTTWENFSGNPVMPGSYDPRDPHVFMYEDHWVMALYENGTTFYTSTNLKEWTYASNVKFGYECPDMYQLNVDGNPNDQKWILQDAAGSYLIGRFDGYFFETEEGPHKMDVGPDFYASQTFYQSTMPDNRIIQLAWLGNWANRNGLDTAPWRHEATFPVEVKLRTLPEGIRITRTPIEEINIIYGKTHQWDAQTLSPEHNIFSGIKSKCYDITAEFDLNNTIATQINFQLADKSIVYDIARRRIFDHPIRLVDNHLKIRILADWGQLEVFINDGQLSYSEKFGFTPSICDISMIADGNVNLLSAAFSALQRIWQDSETSDFKSNLPDSWIAFGGTWADTSIGKQGCSESGDSFNLNSKTGSDFTYECDVRTMIGPSAGLIFRSNSDATAGYLVSTDTNYAKSGTFIKLSSPDRGELARSQVKIFNGDINRVKVVASGNNIKVYLNNTTSPVINYTDSIPKLNGQLGFFVCSSCLQENGNNYPYPGYGVFQNVEYTDDIM